MRKFANGKFLYWFHNHGGEPFHAGAINHYLGRNPAWLCGGVERDGFIHWSEPEILLYDDDPATRMSYPDFIEDGGRYFVTETQKSIARVHEIDPTLLEGLWSQAERRGVARDGLALEVTGDPISPGKTVSLPKLADLRTRRGFSIDHRVRFDELTNGQTILDTRDSSGKGIRLTTSERSTLRLTLSDGRGEASWEIDPGTGPGTLKVGAWQQVTVIVEAGPKIIALVVDGVLNDGGALREYGWGRFPRDLGDVNGTDQAPLARRRCWDSCAGFRLYDRACGSRRPSGTVELKTRPYRVVRLIGKESGI